VNVLAEMTNGTKNTEFLENQFTPRVLYGENYERQVEVRVQALLEANLKLKTI
jgi:hypothetical protein